LGRAAGDIACHTGERSCFKLDGETAPPPADIATTGDMIAAITQLKVLYSANFFCVPVDNKILKKAGRGNSRSGDGCKDDQPDDIAVR